MTNFAYLRVSTDAQDVDNQKLGVMEYANTRGLVPIKIIEDTASGKKAWRERAIGELLQTAKKGDAIIVAEVSRLARSTLQVLEIMEAAAHKQISIHITKNGMTLDGSLASTITATILGLAAEIEREFISMRTREGLAKRKAKGLPLGRPKGSRNQNVRLDEHRADIKKWLALGLAKTSIAKLCGVSTPTLYAYLEREKLHTRKEKKENAR